MRPVGRADLEYYPNAFYIKTRDISSLMAAVIPLSLWALPPAPHGGLPRRAGRAGTCAGVGVARLAGERVQAKDQSWLSQTLPRGAR